MDAFSSEITKVYFGHFEPNVIDSHIFEIDTIVFIINHLFEHKKVINFL